jgi:predicted signal transduction protein with EAL and GGDEF domain
MLKNSESQSACGFEPKKTTQNLQENRCTSSFPCKLRRLFLLSGGNKWTFTCAFPGITGTFSVGLLLEKEAIARPIPVAKWIRAFSTAPEMLKSRIFQHRLNRFAERCRAFNSNFQVSINFSPIQFKGGKDAFHALFEFMKKIDVSMTCIVMELTEGVLLNLDDRMLKKFDMLANQGIQLALDDFGTGYSSLSYITKLKFKFLKIDKVFIRNLESNSTNLALCETIIVMAHKLGMKVIAEGIETEAQQRLLATAGCD